MDLVFPLLQPLQHLTADVRIIRMAQRHKIRREQFLARAAQHFTQFVIDTQESAVSSGQRHTDPSVFEGRPKKLIALSGGLHRGRLARRAIGV